MFLSFFPRAQFLPLTNNTSMPVFCLTGYLIVFEATLVLYTPPFHNQKMPIEIFQMFLSIEFTRLI